MMSGSDPKPPVGNESQPRYPVRIGILCCLVALFFGGVVVPGFNGAHNRNRIPAITTAALRMVAVSIDSYHMDYGLYPPGDVFAGEAVDAIPLDTGSNYLLGPEFRDDHARLKYNPLDVVYILGLLVAWVICIPEKKRVLPHAIQGLLCVAIMLAVATAGEILCVVIALLIGMLHGVTTVVSGRTAADGRNPALPSAERRLAAFIPMAFVVFLTAWVIQKQVEEKSAIVGTRIPFRYVTDGRTDWMLQATGWDRVFDLDLNQWPKSTPDETEEEQWLRFIAEARTGRHTYDPTNGTTSGGDLFRFPDRNAE